MDELIYGVHAIQSVLKNNPSRFVCIYVLRNSLNKRLQLILRESKQFGIPVKYCERRDLNSKAKCITHQGIVAKIREIYIFQEEDMLRFLQSRDKQGLLLLILDNITDPRNMGACLRCALAFGVDMVIVPRNRSAGLTAVVRKSSSGALDHIPFVRVVNLVRTLQLLKEYNIWIIGTVLIDGKNIFQVDLSDRLALVMGSEGLGIRVLTKRYCDELVSIPMVSSSLVASLNVSVATGICLFEIYRRRFCSVL